MLDYVVRSSPILSANEINQTGSSFNPLMTSPVSHEVEHPNFIKKYAAKKVRFLFLSFSFLFLERRDAMKRARKLTENLLLRDAFITETVLQSFYSSS